MNVSGAEDWVNAAEFVPGQPYCGRGEGPCVCVFFGVSVCVFVCGGSWSGLRVLRA